MAVYLILFCVPWIGLDFSVLFTRFSVLPVCLDSILISLMGIRVLVGT